MLTWLVGWHYAFLPSFIVKVVPMFDLAPTWTIAIFFATRGKKVSREVQSTRGLCRATATAAAQSPAPRIAWCGGSARSPERTGTHRYTVFWMTGAA